MSRQPPNIDLRNAVLAKAAEYAREHLTDYGRLVWPLLNPRTALVWNWHMDAVCEHLEAVTRGLIPRLLIEIPPGHSKPLDVNTLVLMADGTRRRLGDIAVGDEVITHMGRPRRVLAVHEQGTLPVVKITTHCGRVVRSEATHPFLTPEGWVPAGDLRVGHALAALALPRCGASSAATEHSHRLAGYIVGDGCTSGGPNYAFAANITCFDDIEAADIFECCAQLGFVAKASTAKCRGAKGRINLSGGIRAWLNAVGLARKTAWTKRVPEFVFRSRPEEIRHFLGAYFACDGSLTRKGAAREDLCISYTSVSKDLLQDVQHLMLRCGMQARLRTRVGKTQAGAEGYVYHCLEMTSRNETAKFVQTVPMYSVKVDRLRAWEPKRTTFDGPYLPDTVVSVEPDGNAECRCLTVEEDHTFTANDLVVHNTTWVSQIWPTWEWRTHPHHRWGFASYGASLSVRDSIKRRAVIESPLYRAIMRPDWQLAADARVKSSFKNNIQGEMTATSVGGAATGFHYDRLIIDDPLKASEALTKALKSHVDWYIETWSSRKRDGAAEVVIMQRLHDRDLAGHLEREGGWEVLRLPERYEPKLSRVTSIGWRDPRTTPGELLNPNRFPEAEVARIWKVLGPRRASAQRQQSPTVGDGAVFKPQWWSTYSRRGSIPGTERLPEHFDRFVVSWDTAVEDTEDNDFWSGQVWGQAGVRYYLLDRVHAQMRFNEGERAVKRLHEKWPDAEVTLIEKSASGPGISQRLKGRSVDPETMRVFPGIPGIVEVPAGKSKVARAELITGLVEAGDVVLPHPDEAPWVEEVLQELADFPAGLHDDDVDALVQAVTWMSGRAPLEQVPIQPRPRRAPLLEPGQTPQQAEAAAALAKAQRQADRAARRREREIRRTGVVPDVKSNQWEEPAGPRDTRPRPGPRRPGGV